MKSSPWSLTLFERTSRHPKKSRTQRSSRLMSSAPRSSLVKLLTALAACEAFTGSKRKPKNHSVIEVPWHKPPSKRRREVLVPEAGRSQDQSSHTL